MMKTYQSEKLFNKNDENELDIEERYYKKCMAKLPAGERQLFYDARCAQIKRETEFEKMIIWEELYEKYNNMSFVKDLQIISAKDGKVLLEIKKN